MNTKAVSIDSLTDEGKVDPEKGSLISPQIAAGSTHDISQDAEEEPPVVGQDLKNKAVLSGTEEDSIFKSESTVVAKEEDIEWVELTEDVFSLIFTCHYHSAGLAFCLFAISIQMAIVGLILADLFYHYDFDYNPFSIPAGVSISVKVASALALLLAVATQDDVLTALVFFQHGYDPMVLEVNPSATKFKWVLSGTCQLLAGSGLLLTIFILVMQSSTVVNMMLNFAALSFISEIDDVAFALAKRGFITDSVERQVNEVAEIRMRSKRKSKIPRRVGFLLVFSGLMVGFGVLTHQQYSGRFLCQSIYLQVGDSFFPATATLSGIYDQTDTIVNNRVTYIERRFKQSMLGYCRKEFAWTLSVWNGTSDRENSKQNPCSWVARSERTESFDVIPTADSEWLISQTSGSRVMPLQTFNMFCGDCHGHDFECGRLGECINNECDCYDTSFGPTCAQSYPCERLAVDLNSLPFPSFTGFGVVPDRFELLREENGDLVTVYEKPVYVFNHDGEYWTVILFSGRRWIVTFSYLFDALINDFTFPQNATRTQVIDFLWNYHGFFTPVFGAFVSDPMDAGTPSDKSSPVGLQWYRTRTKSGLSILFNERDSTQSVGTQLLCSVCDDRSNACGIAGTGGNCTADGVCKCEVGFNGTMCELKSV